MAVVAGVAENIRKAEDLMEKANKTLTVVERQKVSSAEQMQTDLQTVGALSALAMAHISMASFLQMRNDS